MVCSSVMYMTPVSDSEPRENSYIEYRLSCSSDDADHVVDPVLGGIAVNDSIVLVDRINQLRETARSVRGAVVSAARDRLRPIMMTSATTVLALLPMAIGLGEGGELRAPMAIAVIGGLVSSTLMTLVVIPVVYELVERVRS